MLRNALNRDPAERYINAPDFAAAFSNLGNTYKVPGEGDETVQPPDRSSLTFMQRLFMASVWAEGVRCYRKAAELGDPFAARSVGAAVGSNPLSIVVPCHRVVGKDGTLTGYAGGLARKRFLLDLEQPSGEQRLF